MPTDFNLTARTLVDQHYAAGPDDLKKALAKALEEAANASEPAGSPRQRLKRDLADLEKASERGSE